MRTEHEIKCLLAKAIRGVEDLKASIQEEGRTIELAASIGTASGMRESLVWVLGGRSTLVDQLRDNEEN